MSNFWKRVFAAVATFTVAAGFLVPTSANALTLSGNDFVAGDIISDAQFFDETAMTEQEIQTFLSKKVRQCGSLNLCLSVYTQETFTREATSVQDDGLDPLCESYAGAKKETAAQIIYKVQRACNISAKVLLVLLQKEQGLITNANPTADKLKIATGYACPDTAPCDAKYFGFYNQVYSAASQLKRYTEPTSRFYNSKPVGVRSPILFHPNARCGTKSVNIMNLATHALYIYTPYTPNAAALANLTGTGDSCSSYGNSNFWEWYSYWFNAHANLSSDIVDQGAAITGDWGTLIDDSSCTETANTCSADYDNAVATWNITEGLKYVTGPIATKYKSAGGVSGLLGPISRPTELVNGGSNGDGSRQKFAKGFIYRDPTDAPFIVLNDVFAYYSEAGGPSGSLGWPTGDASCTDGKCDQDFAGGYVVSSPTDTFLVLDGAIGEYLLANGGINSPWGLPLSAAETRTFGSFGTGRIQQFENGTVYEKDDAAYLVADTLAAALEDVGGVEEVGWPLAEPVRADGQLYQLYSAGRVVKVGSEQGVLIPTDTLRALRVAGGMSGYLGVPTNNAMEYRGRDGFLGSKQAFEGGTIVRGTPGAFAMPDVLWDAYLAKNGARGKYGWPKGIAKSTSTTWTQSFQRGSIKVYR
ncbi:MAG: hypothetical protein RL378_541 [Actinomycetota bacterium]